VKELRRKKMKKNKTVTDNLDPRLKALKEGIRDFQDVMTIASNRIINLENMLREIKFNTAFTYEIETSLKDSPDGGLYSFEWGPSADNPKNYRLHLISSYNHSCSAFIETNFQTRVKFVKYLEPFIAALTKHVREMQTEIVKEMQKTPSFVTDIMLDTMKKAENNGK